MPDTSPREGMLQKIFGPSFMTKKRTEDIELPSEKKTNVGQYLIEYSKKSKKKSIFEPEKGSKADTIKKGYDILNEFSKKK